MEQVINKMRDDMIRSQSSANTTALLGFDNLVNQLRIFSSQIQMKNQEIETLRELCKKNNVEIPSTTPQNGDTTPKKPAQKKSS